MYADDSHEHGNSASTKTSTTETTRGGRLGNHDLSIDNGTYVLVYDFLKFHSKRDFFHLRYSSLLVVLIPIIFTVLLCAITYCIYRYNRRRTDRNPTNSPIGTNINFKQN